MKFIVLFEGSHDQSFLGVFSSISQAESAAKKRDLDDQLGPGDEMLGDSREYSYLEVTLDSLV